MTVKLNIPCKVCGKVKYYKNPITFEKCKDKPCRSCANSLSRGGSGNRVVVDGSLTCISCNKKKPINSFHLRSDGKLMSYCKKCQSKKRKDYFKEHYKFSRYNITKEEFNSMLTFQKNKCNICKEELSNPRIDHCHKSGKVRGLLCHHCNVALGHVKDNINILKNMIKYLEKEIDE